MKQSLLFLGLIFLITGSLKAQTNFNTWAEFQSPEHGLSLKHPESWEVNEVESGFFIFKNPYERLGQFRIKVEVCADSADALLLLDKVEEQQGGVKRSVLEDRVMLTYKVMGIRNGDDLETHYWVIAYGNKLFYCSYEFRVSLRNNPNINEEIKQAYSVIESMHFKKS